VRGACSLAMSHLAGNVPVVSLACAFQPTTKSPSIADLICVWSMPGQNVWAVAQGSGAWPKDSKKQEHTFGPES